MPNNENELPHSRVNRPDENDPVFFYPKEFYPFDNFSAFQVEWRDVLWPTVEHAYQAAKFMGVSSDVVELIKNARSPHDAQKIANEYKVQRVTDWNEIKVGIMKEINRCKIDQHPYVLKKLLESGNRIIIEDSWRDSEWGWGENRNGENLLGKLWMELREEYRAVI